MSLQIFLRKYIIFFMDMYLNSAGLKISFSVHVGLFNALERVRKKDPAEFG